MPRALSRAALTALAALALAACFTPPGGDRFPGGYERDDFACANRRDDDGDGMTDCRDPDCLMHSTVCGQIVPAASPDFPQPENTVPLCRDRVDNDENGKFDCGESSCQAVLEACCVREYDDVSCSDGLDNDQNGFTDCGDFGCRNGRFVTVCKHETLCADGIDNDADGAIDCADSDCTGIAGPDGMPCPCLGGGMPETTLALCSDGIDNDCNGYADCGDHSCSLSTDMTIVDHCNANAENTLARCMDGIDNDGNHYIDCADFSCSRSTDPAIMSYCAGAGTPPSEAVDPVTHVVHPEYCNDGIDNDHNGYVDCADHGCSQSTSGAVLAVCFEDVDPVTGVTTPSRCTDGIDNDGDGVTDCADFDCAVNPATSERGPSTTPEVDCVPGRTASGLCAHDDFCRPPCDAYAR